MPEITIQRVVVIAGVGVAVAVAFLIRLRKQRKLITVKRVGDRAGRPIVATGWGDILAVFPGAKNPRIFFPNGDEILARDLTTIYFSTLPQQQNLYVAPNGEDFNPIEALDRLNEENSQATSEMYNRMVDLVFQKTVQQFTDSEIYKKQGEKGLEEYVKNCVSTYSLVSKFASATFTKL